MNRQDRRAQKATAAQPPAPRARRCENCSAFEPTNPAEKVGECRDSSPVVLLTSPPGAPVAWHSAFPPVKTSSWCRRWAANQEKA